MSRYYNDDLSVYDRQDPGENGCRCPVGTFTDRTLMFHVMDFLNANPKPSRSYDQRDIPMPEEEDV